MLQSSLWGYTLESLHQWLLKVTQRMNGSVGNLFGTFTKVANNVRQLLIQLRFFASLSVLCQGSENPVVLPAAHVPRVSGNKNRGGNISRELVWEWLIWVLAEWAFAADVTGGSFKCGCL